MGRIYNQPLGLGYNRGRGWATYREFIRLSLYRLSLCMIVSLNTLLPRKHQLSGLLHLLVHNEGCQTLIAHKFS